MNDRMMMDNQLSLSYKKILGEYLKTGQETDLYHVAQFGKEMMNKGIGPELVVEMHLDALRKINKAEKTYPEKTIDDSFTVLMEGIMAYGMAYTEFINSRAEGYLAEIRELNKRLSERLTEMTALYETVKATVSSLALDEVLSSVFNSAVKTLKADTGSLMLLDPEEGVLTIKRAHGLDEEIIRKTRIKVGEGIAGTVAQSGEPLVFHGKVDSPQAKGRMKYAKVNSICSPLKTKKGVVGIVNLNRKEDSEPFTQDNLTLLSTMAHEAASAIENAGLYKDLHESYLSTIRALTSALEVKDHYTRGHSDAVARCAVKIAKKLGLSLHETEGIEVAAILHDIGKIGIQEDILNKPGRLDDEEWKEVKKHPEYSLKIFEDINFPWDIRPSVYAHHERYEGNGYPCGLKGEDIPLGARILAVADLYDAMTSDRAYRKRLSKETVIEELKRVAGTQIDPEIGKVFIEMLLQGEV
jgi:putative nucleotidyltransferase with HDIG domain